MPALSRHSLNVAYGHDLYQQAPPKSLKDLHCDLPKLFPNLPSSYRLISFPEGKLTPIESDGELFKLIADGSEIVVQKWYGSDIAFNQSDIYVNGLGFEIVAGLQISDLDNWIDPVADYLSELGKNIAQLFSEEEKQLCEIVSNYLDKIYSGALNHSVRRQEHQKRGRRDGIFLSAAPISPFQDEQPLPERHFNSRSEPLIAAPPLSGELASQVAQHINSLLPSLINTISKQVEINLINRGVVGGVAPLVSHKAQAPQVSLREIANNPEGI